MAGFKKSVLLVAIIVSLFSVTLIVLGIRTVSFFEFFTLFGTNILWWFAYIYLRKDKSFSFWISFSVVNLFWWPLLIQTVRRIWFVIEHGGMDRPEPPGSPVAFLLGFAGEQILFVPLSIAMVAGIRFMRASR